MHIYKYKFTHIYNKYICERNENITFVTLLDCVCNLIADKNHKIIVGCHFSFLFIGPIFLFSVTISLNNRKFVVTTQKKLKYDIGCDNAELPFFHEAKMFNSTQHEN